MIKILRAALAAVLATSLSACSMFHSAMPADDGSPETTVEASDASPPPLALDRGRIYFYRMGSYSPDTFIHPEIRVDGKIVGVARSGSYFVVDLPTGVYTVAPSWNIDRTLNVDVRAGQAAYVQVEIRFPVLAGRVVLSETSQRIGVNMVSTLDYESNGGK